MTLGDFFGPQFQNGLTFLFQSAIIWVPIVLIMVGFEIWLRFKRETFIENQKWTLVEVRIPKDVFKSPLAMELVLIKALHQTGGIGTWYHKYVLGQVLLWSSLEIVSIEGRIHFFIRVPSKFRTITESQIYAQYPQAEITEVESDYAIEIPSVVKGGEWSVYGTEFGLKKADPYPIKTYIDFGLDKASTSLEAEQQIDPITATLEYMGAMSQGEQMWLQILVRSHRAKRYTDPKAWMGNRELKDVAKEEIGKILAKPLFEPGKDKEGAKQLAKMDNLSKTQQETITAIERNLDKTQFDCGIRAIYTAKKDKFNTAHITGLLSLMKQFSSGTLNEFKVQNATGFDYPWQDFSGNRAVALKKEMLDAYKLRSYFYPPHRSAHVANKFVHRKPILLSSEELATIYHFPGRVSETPSFKRIESKKAEPPVNLPM